jgi:enolase
VDFAVGASVAYINLRGFLRPERSQKVARLAEINEEIRANNNPSGA